MSDAPRRPNEEMEPEAPQQTGAEDATQTDATQADPTSWRKRVAAVFIGVLAVSIMVLSLDGGFASFAKSFQRLFAPPPPAAEEEPTLVHVEAPATKGWFTFNEMSIHPDVVFQPYTSGPVLVDNVASRRARLIQEFRELIDMYAQRQGVDDNFTIRVIDNRKNVTLEVYELEETRRQFEERGSMNWGYVDNLRRRATTELMKKYRGRGFPNDALTVRWGRANQVKEAREREAPFIEYEIRLAQYLGLSLLATEIGTVETFNSDRLVSSVGARSRYQMMPAVLRQNDIYHYTLSTAANGRVNVYEEWHPLLTMEGSFRTLRGYANAVGHEIPGISAYHTGPGNVFMLYRMFLTHASELFDGATSVVDAYMWAVTEGYDEVSRGTSFKSYSRGYVPSAYGSLRATQELPIDTTRTIQTVRVQLEAGESVLLSRLLRTLEQSEASLDWGPGTEDMSTYDAFRSMNPHFALPDGGGNGGVPPKGDVRLVASTENVPVRFFLPVAAPAVLEAAGLSVLDEERTFRYDRDTFGIPDASEVTHWDQEYAELVRNAGLWGFNREVRQRLRFLRNRFEELAAANPSHYRLMQLDIIREHAGLWNTSGWEKLADAVSSVGGSLRAPVRPPSPLG